MFPIIARNLFNLQERMLGRRSFEVLEDLLGSQHWPLEQMQALQLERLRQLTSAAGERITYWQQVLNDRNISPDALRSLDDLRRFPLLDKQIIRRHREQMACKEGCRRLQLVRTSGSTNEALEFYTTSTREAHINAARMRGHEWVGIRRGDRELYYWGSPVELNKQDRVKRVRDWLINDALTNGFEVTPGRLRKNFDFWLKWRPRCIFGYPSTFVLTVNMARQLGIDLAVLGERGLKVIVTTSEMLSELDRKLIETGFGVPVRDSYGLREVGLISHECELGVMHTTDEQVLLETIDPVTLEPTANEGELVATNLVESAFPVIRYRTGDIVSLSRELCPCGRTLQSINISGGRAVEFVVTNRGKWVVGYSFIYIARAVKGILKFQVIQDKLGEIEIKLVVDGNFPTDGVEQVKQQARNRLDSDDRISVHLVDDIKPAPSGKYRPVISKVAEQMYRSGSVIVE